MDAEGSGSSDSLEMGGCAVGRLSGDDTDCITMEDDSGTFKGADSPEGPATGVSSFADSATESNGRSTSFVGG